jgi:hypothetical protein
LSKKQPFEIIEIIKVFCFVVTTLESVQNIEITLEELWNDIFKTGNNSRFTYERMQFQSQNYSIK